MIGNPTLMHYEALGKGLAGVCEIMYMLAQELVNADRQRNDL